MKLQPLIPCLALAAACTHPTLVPEGGAATFASGDGVVLLGAPGWRHSDEVAAATTPVFVTVANQGPGALEVSYSDFTLVDEAGKVHRAIPPLALLKSLFGTAGPGAPGGGDGVLELARRMSTADIGEGWGRELPENETSPNAVEPYWPRDYRRVLDRALAMGRLGEGKRRDGYVFFQPAWSARQVVLHFRFARATGPTHDLAIDFAVER